MAFFFCQLLYSGTGGIIADLLDLYFIFAGFHLAFSTYMAVGIPCELKHAQRRHRGAYIQRPDQQG